MKWQTRFLINREGFPNEFLVINIKITRVIFLKHGFASRNEKAINIFITIPFFIKPAYLRGSKHIFIQTNTFIWRHKHSIVFIGVFINDKMSHTKQLVIFRQKIICQE